MAALSDEHQQFELASGVPIVNGYIYIGARNQDPVLNPITIYSDRDLTTTIANPQRTDSDGRAVNKIWVPGRYSIRVSDEDNVQKYQELDAGESPASGITSLTNVQGINAITAEASPAIAAYTNREIYVFQAAAANTGAVTLDAGGGAKALKKLHDRALVTGDIVANQIIMAVYQEDDDIFEFLNPSRGVFQPDVGADVASASALAIGIQGNVFTVTGNATINTMASKGVGTSIILYCTGTPTFTHSADIDLPGDRDIVATAGDLFEFYEYASGDWRLIGYQKASGSGSVLLSDTTTGGTSVDFTIPSGVTEIEGALVAISTSGTDDIWIQLGDAGGVESSGYSGAMVRHNASSNSQTANSSSFIVSDNVAAAEVCNVAFSLTLMVPGSNTWMFRSWTDEDNGDNNEFNIGFKSTSAELTTVRLTTAGGTQTFDAMNAAVRYKF